jgi:hypothetical protein
MLTAHHILSLYKLYIIICALYIIIITLYIMIICVRRITPAHDHRLRERQGPHTIFNHDNNHNTHINLIIIILQIIYIY